MVKRRGASTLLCCILPFLSVALSLRAADPFVDTFSVTPAIQDALDSISANSLRGHLSFIASDLLEGRDSPSRGLDIAAEYIAAQFRRAGLEPIGDDGYFQTARFFLAEQDMQHFGLRWETGAETVVAQPDEVSFRLRKKLQISVPEVFKLRYAEEALSALRAEDLQGKVVLTEFPDFQREDPSQWERLLGRQQAFLRKLAGMHAALLISVDRQATQGDGAGAGRLIDPEKQEGSRETRQPVPWVQLYSPKWVAAYDRTPDGLSQSRVDLTVPEPVERQVLLRNVIGLLRGSDPKLRDTYVLVTAHYDHVGLKTGEQGDRIYNGANDDGSGTVSVIELASALSRLSTRPKRSLLFMTVFGEEKGLMGSSYYARHPVVPLEKTIANINLEVVGRTDGSEGLEKGRAALTGYDYSTVGKTLKKAGSLVGVDVYHHDRFGDQFFNRSDNWVFAAAGIPSHSICSVFTYPDYHRVTDQWERIDYPNLEKLVRTVALGLIILAENPVEPGWNEANPKTAPHLEAWRKLKKL